MSYTRRASLGGLLASVYIGFSAAGIASAQSSVVLEETTSAPEGSVLAGDFRLETLAAFEAQRNGGGLEDPGKNGAAAPSTADDIQTPLLKKLLQKGLLNHDEAAELDKEKKPSFLSSLAERISISGLSYFGYTYTFQRVGSDFSAFELRRNYLTVQGTLTDMFSVRTTLDVTREAGGGNVEVRLKYGYLYAKDFLPSTSLEVGVSHTPWLDWEEHHGWFYRSVERAFIEVSDSAGLFTSADLGANLKTSTPYVSSEIGIFNGEGYDHLDRVGGTPFSEAVAGRATFHALATGDKKVNPTKDKYLDVSFNTFDSFHHNGGSASASVPGSSTNARGDLDRLVFQFHMVFNMPMFLVAAQYAYNQERFETVRLDNQGVSVNGEFRPVEDWALFGRFDYWRIEHGDDRKFYVYGVAYSLNRFVKLIANGITSNKDGDTGDFSRAMISAEVEW